MIIDKRAVRIDKGKKAGPGGPANGGFYTLAWVDWGKAREYLKVKPEG